MQTQHSSETTKGKPGRRKWMRRVLLGIVILLVLLVTAELIARYVFGFGDPPVYVRDAAMEYLAEPSRSYRRFGQRISFNQWSMRSDEFSKTKKSDDELRVLVLGDSIINGGAHVDQSELVTHLLQMRLAKQTGRPVVVGNISAPSWGVPNMLAYIQRFGTFDADLAIVVLNAFDVWDVPADTSQLPEGGLRPTFAIEELAVRAIQRLSKDEQAFMMRTFTSNDLQTVAEAMQDLRNVFKSEGIPVVFVLHSMEAETLGIPLNDTLTLRRTLHALDVPMRSTREAYNVAISESDQPLYIDGLHLSVRGHHVLANLLVDIATEFVDVSSESEEPVSP